MRDGRSRSVWVARFWRFSGLNSDFGGVVDQLVVLQVASLLLVLHKFLDNFGLVISKHHTLLNINSCLWINILLRLELLEYGVIKKVNPLNSSVWSGLDEFSEKVFAFLGCFGRVRDRKSVSTMGHDLNLEILDRGHLPG